MATYATPLDPENEAPERVDVRYARRMPEAKMQRLIDGVVDLTERTLQRGSFQFRVFLADGKREIWRRVDEQPVFADFIPILDFYHAADHLSKAAEHRAKPTTGLHRGATNCAMRRVRRIVCCARWPITGANSRRVRNAMAR